MKSENNTNNFARKYYKKGDAINGVQTIRIFCYRCSKKEPFKATDILFVSQPAVTSSIQNL